MKDKPKNSKEVDRLKFEVAQEFGLSKKNRKKDKKKINKS